MAVRTIPQKIARYYELYNYWATHYEDGDYALFEELMTYDPIALRRQLHAEIKRPHPREYWQPLNSPLVIALDLGLMNWQQPALEPVIDQVLAENAQAVADYQAGNQRAFGALVGALRKLGINDIQPASALLKARLGGDAAR